MTRLQLRHLTTAVETALREAETEKHAVALYADAADLRHILALLSGSQIVEVSSPEPQVERGAVDTDSVRDALREAIAIVEGRASRSPFVAVEDWKEIVEAAAAPQTQEKP